MNRAATIALAPLGLLYGAAMRTRRALYRRGLLRVHDLGVPVISVGNVTTGGTGKTPLVEWIAGEAAGRNRRVCVLTRGYRRSNPTERVIVSNGTEILSDAKHAGDEALLLAEQLKGRAAVISDADRVSAGRWAIDNFQSDVLVLDDGFQHLRAGRTLNIVTIDATNADGNGRMLPAGILREPFAALSGADCIVITRTNLTNNTDDVQTRIERTAGNRPVFRSRMKTLRLRSINSTAPTGDGDEIRKERVAAFCGVGNPNSFFTHLSRDGYQLCHTRAFRDHHNYTQGDIDQFVREASGRGAQILLTTAKDEVKLRSLRFDLPCYCTDITIEIAEEAKLRALISRAIGIA
jgi:tetraacyldisaccharide 4'-kinase